MEVREAGRPAALILPDRSAAFDAGSQPISLSRLRDVLVITPPSLKWVQIVLIWGSQRVKIGHVISSSVWCSTGLCLIPPSV